MRLNLPDEIGSALNIEQKIEFARLPSGWPAVLLALMASAALFAVVFLYRRETRGGWSRKKRTGLALLRCLLLAVLMVIWLDPVLATYIHRRRDAFTLILADTSASMSLKDAYAHPESRERARDFLNEKNEGEAIARTAILKRLLQTGDSNLLGRLREHNGVRLYAVDRTARLLGTWGSTRRNGKSDAVPPSAGAPVVDSQTPETGEFQIDPRDPVTDLGHSIAQAIQSAGDAPLAGIVLLSDGAVNQGLSDVQIGETAAHQGVPVYAIGIGDSSPPANLSVLAVEAPTAVFAGDPFMITAHFAARGLAGRNVRAELTLSGVGPDGDGRHADAVPMHIDADPWTHSVTFEHRAGAPGTKTLRVAVEALDEEITREDNARFVTVTVQEDQLRVLLVAGGPDWDYRHLSRLLERDKAIDVSCWLQSASKDAVRDGNTVIDHLPATAKEINAYDAIILLDPQLGEIDREWASHVSRWVSEVGGGLFYRAGRKFTSALMRAEELGVLTSLLPVVADSDSELTLNRIGHYQKVPHPVVVPDESAEHPMLRQADATQANKQLWHERAEVYWHYPVLHEKPVARVLLRHGHPQMRSAYGSHVLAACQTVGAGRTAWLGIDGTWRWRRGDEEFFDRFWIGAIRYLAEGRMQGANRRGSIRLDRDTYALGEAIRIEARLLEPNLKPRLAEEVMGGIDDESGRQATVRFRALPDGPGWFAATFIPEATGTHKIHILSEDDVAESGAPITRTFQVSTPNLEMQNAQMNRRGLQALAVASGGAYFDLAEWDQVPGAIEDQHEEVVITDRPRPIWDRAYTLMLLTGLLSLEWALRKRARLL